MFFFDLPRARAYYVAGRKGVSDLGGPIIIWPPGICDGYPGCYQDACQSELGSGYYDCTDYYTWEMGAAACCPYGD